MDDLVKMVATAIVTAVATYLFDRVRWQRSEGIRKAEQLQPLCSAFLEASEELHHVLDTEASPEDVHQALRNTTTAFRRLAIVAPDGLVHSAIDLFTAVLPYSESGNDAYSEAKSAFVMTVRSSLPI